MKKVKRLKPAEVIKDFQQNVNPNIDRISKICRNLGKITKVKKKLYNNEKKMSKSTQPTIDKHLSKK